MITRAVIRHLDSSVSLSTSHTTEESAMLWLVSRFVIRHFYDFDLKDTHELSRLCNRFIPISTRLEMARAIAARKGEVLILYKEEVECLNEKTAFDPVWILDD